jgi:PAS domain S-box-containing protein
VLRRAEAAIEEKAEIFMQLTAEIDATNRLLGLQPETDPTREALTYLETVVHTSPDAMLSMSPDLVVKTWNPGAARLFGYAEAAIIGRHVGVLVPEERRGDLYEVARCLIACGEVAPYDAVGRRSDGSIVEVTVALAALRDARGRLIGYSALLRDLTEARRTQDNLFAALDERDRLVEEDRLSRDLHDFVAQQLSDCASALQSVLSIDPRPELLSRLENVIHKLDTTLSEIRSTRTLHHSPRGCGIRAQLLELGATVTANLGFAPKICFVGAVDDDVSDDLGEHLIAVAREALSNVVRHAQATRVGVVVQVGREVMIEVVDDGRGLGRATRRFGLMSIEARAQAVGGAFSLTSRDGAGTRLEWRAPLRHQHNTGSAPYCGRRHLSPT